MIANSLRCSSCYLFRKSFHIYNKVNFAERILFRLFTGQRFAHCLKNVYPIINNNIFKLYSQVSIKPLENIVDDGPAVKGKIFAEKENAFFHEILESKEQYQKCIYIKDNHFLKGPDFDISENEFNDIVNKTDWSTSSVEDIVQSFSKASAYCAKYLKLPISDDMFKSLCFSLVQVLNKLNDEQLFNIFKVLDVWTPCDSVKADNFLTLWKTMDQVCVSRLIKGAWDINTNLYVMDLWYTLKLTRLSEFVFKGQRKVSRKALKLEPHQLVMMLFFMNTCRKVHNGISMYEYEYKLENSLSKLSLEEISIAASGFFKTQSKISSNNCLSLLVKRLTDEVDTAHNITIATILKGIRYSFKPSLASDVNLLVTKLIPRMSTKTISGCVHTLLVLTPCAIKNERAIDKLVERFLEDPAAARLKDLEKICFILSLYNYIPDAAPDVLKTIVNELNQPGRESEILLHPRSFVKLLFALSLFKVYPESFIARALDKTFIKETYGTHPYKIDRTLFALDYNTELECPDAKVPRLSDSNREYIAKKTGWYIVDEKKTNPVMHDLHFRDLKKSAEKMLGGEDFFLIHYILPHHSKPDIIYCLDHDGKPIPIPEEMRSKPHFSGIVRPTIPGDWRCLVVGSRSMYPFNGQTPLGELTVKIRQLEIIGYKPILIPWYQWFEKREEVFLDYVEKRIFAKD